MCFTISFFLPSSHSKHLVLHHFKAIHTMGRLWMVQDKACLSSEILLYLHLHHLNRTLWSFVPCHVVGDEGASITFY
ncbi:hypothetical protein Naga_100002g67 [Nannochloropsis gaditana]|uniref:Uncharacterized protein n=1 Tax=Nannochloropsis gaditana TaxID=72520 RepID=W7U7L7_9STRA|nr:hypothetical protein Naga_100002g67 [Nannochloropsis gaditana]